MRDHRLQRSHSAPIASRPDAWRSLAVGVVSLLVTVPILARQEPAGRGQQPEDDTTFVEEIAVTEVRVPVDFPGLRDGAVRDLTPDDLVVVEGDQQREVTRLALVSAEASPWNVLVYFDEVLSKPATLPLAARVLSENARALTRLGRVRAVWAGRSWGEHREILRATANEAAVTEGLADAARQAANDLSSRRTATRSTGPGSIPPAMLRERVDHLLVEAADGCSAGPCLLVLVSDGFFPEGGEAGSDPFATQLARVLAGYGWTVLSLPLDEPEPVEIELGRPGAGTDFESWKEDTGGVVIRGSRARRVKDAQAQELDDALAPELGPLQLLAASTAGGVVRSPENVEAALRDLRDRWWVYFRTQRASEGELRPLRVRFSEVSSFAGNRETSAALGLTDTLEPIRAPRWIRSASPLEVTAARLRALRDGATLYGDFYVAGARAGGETLSWETPVEEEMLVRITALRPGAEQASKRLVEIAPAEGKLSVELMPQEQGGVLVVDEIGTGRWGPATFGER